MNKELKQLIKNFESDSTGKERFSDFIIHCYHAFDDRSNSKKSGKSINKYDILRQHLINYLIDNERAITIELSR
mgnify:FL=1